MGEYIVVDDVTRICCHHYLGNLISLVVIDDILCDILWSRGASIPKGAFSS